MTSTGDQLVEEYLRRLDTASVFLGDERRTELRQEIAEHIEAGLEEADAAHAEAVRAVLKRLGPPADIVASELGPRSTGSTPVVRQESPSAGATGHAGGSAPVSAPVPPPPLPPHPPTTSTGTSTSTRKVPLALIGGVATAVVLGVLAVGAMFSSSEAGQQRQVPTITPSQSPVPDTATPDRPPEAVPDAPLDTSELPPTDRP